MSNGIQFFRKLHKTEQTRLCRGPGTDCCVQAIEKGNSFDTTFLLNGGDCDHKIIHLAWKHSIDILHRGMTAYPLQCRPTSLRFFVPHMHQIFYERAGEPLIPEKRPGLRNADLVFEYNNQVHLPILSLELARGPHKNPKVYPLPPCQREN